MPRYRSIEEILQEEDDLGLLQVTLRSRAVRSPDRERDAQLVAEVNKFALNNTHAIDFALKHGGFSRHDLQGFV